MAKRISVTLRDDEYAGLVRAVSVSIAETGTMDNPTDYIRRALVSAICRDLGIANTSELTARTPSDDELVQEKGED